MKGKLLAIGNDGGYSYFIFKKEQILLSLFREMLSPLSGIMLSYVESMVYENWDEEFVEKEIKLKERNIVGMVDERYNFHDADFRIDVIFGKEKVFMICNMKKEVTSKIRAFVKESFDFIK